MRALPDQNNQTVTEHRQTKQISPEFCAYWLSLVVFITFATVASSFLYLAFRSTTSELYGPGAIFIVLGLTAFASLIFSRRNRMVQGVSLMLSTVAILIPLVPVFVSGIELPLALLIFVPTLVIAGQTLTGRYRVVHLSVGYVATLVTLAGTFIFGKIGLMTPTALQVFVWFAAVVIFFIFTVWTLRQFPYFSYRIKWLIATTLVMMLAIFTAFVLGGGTLLMTQDAPFGPQLEGFASIISFAITFTTIALGICILLISLISGPLVAPVGHLTQVAERVADGELNLRANVKGYDEVGRLADAFNTVALQLQDLISSLEGQVRERTAELTQAMEIGRQIASIREVDALLPQATSLIQSRFQLYSVQIYVLDDLRQNLLLQAITGHDNEAISQSQAVFSLEEDHPVSQVARTGKQVIVSDHDEHAAFTVNALFPEVRSRLTLPLAVEDQVIGVLDMYTQKVNIFNDDNLSVFEALATQIANAI